jgi:hypothetical protein
MGLIGLPSSMCCVQRARIVYANVTENTQRPVILSLEKEEIEKCRYQHLTQHVQDFLVIKYQLFTVYI